MTDLKYELYNLSVQHWLNYEVLTWRWFLKIFLIAVFIFLFWKLVDRKHLREIITYGLLMSLISTILDITGTYLVFWVYPYRVLPIEFSEIHDVVIIPIAYMLLYQYFIRWKPFIAASIVFSAFTSFIIERLFILLDFYKPIVWKSIYSFVLFTLISITSKYIVSRLYRTH